MLIFIVVSDPYTGTMIFCGDVRQILCVIKVNFVFCCDFQIPI